MDGTEVYMKAQSSNFVIKLLRLRENTDFLTVEEAAAYLRLNVKTLYRFAQQGKVRVTKIGSQYRFSRVALEHYVRGRNQSLPVGFR
jgi:excisionase family DNA binding protein